MKTISRFGMSAALLGVLCLAPSAEAGWRRKVVVVTSTQTVYAAPAPVQTAWRTSNGDVIQTNYNMIAGDPIGTSAPPLPVVTSYEVVKPRRIKVVTPRQVTYYRNN